MAKTKISEYSSTANNNTDINSINLAEGMAPSLVNNAIRTLMAQLKNFQDGSAGDNVTVGGNLSVTGTSTSTTTSTTTSGPLPLDFDAIFNCDSYPSSISISITNITGGTPPYSVGTTYFPSEAAALANASWTLGISISYTIPPTNGTYWMVIKDDVGTIVAKDVTTTCS